jgi:membrane protease YdiL (CAAX protease family)
MAIRDVRVVPGGSVTHFPGLLGPALAAFVIVALRDGAGGVRKLLGRMVQVSSPTHRFLAYSLSPVAFLALALVIVKATGGPMPSARDFSAYSGLPVLPLTVVVLLAFLFNGWGEETGWRGFALGPLQERFGAVKGTLVLALIWAGWHTPSFWFVEGYRSMGALGLLTGFGLGICAGSVVLARIANRTDGSILAAAIWHGTYNMTSATLASRGVIGAATTTCVMLWAVLILLEEWRRPRQLSRVAVPTLRPEPEALHPLSTH